MEALEVTPDIAKKIVTNMADQNPILLTNVFINC
jgi:hypothetical protein